MSWWIKLEAVRHPGRVRGLSMLEILVAIVILSFGLLPIFRLMSQSRQVMYRSVLEMKAMAVASSLMDALHRAPASVLARFPTAELPETQLAARGIVPPAPDPTLPRMVSVRYLNDPSLPRERFSNPFGQILEMTVRVTSAAPGTAYHGRPIVTLRDIRYLDR